MLLPQPVRGRPLPREVSRVAASFLEAGWRQFPPGAVILLPLLVLLGSLGPYFCRPVKAPQHRDACPLYDVHSEHVEEANTSIGHPPVLPSKIGSLLPNRCQREGMLGCTNGLLPEPSSVTLIHEPTHHLGSFEDPLGVHVKGGSEGTVHPTTHHHGHPFQCCSRHAGTHSSIDISRDFSVLP